MIKDVLVYLQNPLINIRSYLNTKNNIFWLLTLKKPVIVPFSNRKMLLMKSARTDFPEIMNTSGALINVEH